MHLSKEISKHLIHLNSNVALASTIDGTLPDKYAFSNKGKRKFRAEFASNENEFSVILYESTNKQEYENCFARGLFTDSVRLASVIDYWSGKREQISKIKNAFNELVFFEEPELKNPNPEIEQAWRKIQNMFFNETGFWRNPEWNHRYLVMLNEAKSHHAFQNYFPFRSHYVLRFSVDKELHETWNLSAYMIPPVQKSDGNFYVSYKDESMSGEYFDTAKAALNFYAEKLKEIKPTKWGGYLT